MLCYDPHTILDPKPFYEKNPCRFLKQGGYLICRTLFTVQLKSIIGLAVSSSNSTLYDQISYFQLSNKFHKLEHVAHSISSSRHCCLLDPEADVHSIWSSCNSKWPLRGSIDNTTRLSTLNKYVFLYLKNICCYKFCQVSSRCFA